jgi:tellurite resistance protein
MADGILEERRNSLEEAFFHKENERLRARLQAEREREATRAALQSECGLEDKELLDRLVELGIRVDTVEALVLVPLALVAWADGKMDPNERDAVLQGAKASGIEPGTPAYGLLEAWTTERPSPELFDSWRAYIKALVKELSADQRWSREERILGRARGVAEAAGGILGIATVSKEEESVLAQLKAAFEES